MRATMPHKKSTALAMGRDQPANRFEEMEEEMVMIGYLIV
jgi:hypothetical protein